MRKLIINNKIKICIENTCRFMAILCQKLILFYGLYVSTCLHSMGNVSSTLCPPKEPSTALSPSNIVCFRIRKQLLG